MYGSPFNMKSSSHKTWQTPLLFLKSLQIQNLERKKWGTWHIMSPPSEKVGGHVPRVPHQIAPMLIICTKTYITWRSDLQLLASVFWLRIWTQKPYQKLFNQVFGWYFYSSFLLHVNSTISSIENFNKNIGSKLFVCRIKIVPKLCLFLLSN